MSCLFVSIVVFVFNILSVCSIKFALFAVFVKFVLFCVLRKMVRWYVATLFQSASSDGKMV